MKLKLAILSAFVFGAEAAPSINLRVFGGGARQSVKVEHDYAASADAKKDEAAKKEAPAQGDAAKKDDSAKEDAEKASVAGLEDSKISPLGGFAVDVSVAKEAMFFGFTGGMHLLGEGPAVKFKVSETKEDALVKAYDDAVKNATDKAEAAKADKFADDKVGEGKLFKDQAARDAEKTKAEKSAKDAKDALSDATAAMIAAHGDAAQKSSLQDGDKAKTGDALRAAASALTDDVVRAVAAKVAPTTTEEEIVVTTQSGPMYYFGVHGGMHLTDKISGAVTVGPAFRNFTYAISKGQDTSSTGVDVGVLGAVRGTYKVTDMVGVFAEVGGAVFFGDGAPAKDDKSKEAKKDEAKKEEKAAEGDSAKKKSKQDSSAEAKEGEKAAKDTSDAAATSAHKIKKHVPGNVLFGTVGVSVKLM